MGPPPCDVDYLPTVEKALEEMLGRTGPSSADRPQPHLDLQVLAPGTSWPLPHQPQHGGPKAAEGVTLEAVEQQESIAAQVVRCCLLAQQAELAQRQQVLSRRLPSLQEVFTMHVMCDYTPTHPKHLPKSKWASVERLAIQLEHYAPAEVKQLGRSGLKQMITVWFADHPAFAGLPFSAWCKKLKDDSPQAQPRGQVIKFSFEYTPRLTDTVGVSIWN